jgi:hypothetical protein
MSKHPRLALQKPLDVVDFWVEKNDNQAPRR